MRIGLLIKVEKKASNILRNIFVGIVRNLGLSTAYVYIINIIPKILLEIKFAIMRIILATLTLKSIWKVLVPNFASQLSYKRNLKNNNEFRYQKLVLIVPCKLHTRFDNSLSFMQSSVWTILCICSTTLWNTADVVLYTRH